MQLCPVEENCNEKKNSNNKSSAHLKGWSTKKKDQEWSESNQANRNPDVDNDGWFEPNFTFFLKSLRRLNTVSLIQFLYSL